MSDAWMTRTVVATAMMFPLAVPAADGPIPKLLKNGTLACEPLITHYCANIHVSCANPSSIRTFPFQLHAARDKASITAPDKADDDIVALYRDGTRVTWAPDDSFLLLEPRNGPGYLKLTADGIWIMRYYLRNDAWMARGSCE